MTNINFLSSRIYKKLLTIPHVKAVHEFHVWQLVDQLSIASTHIVISKNAPWEQVWFR